MKPKLIKTEADYKAVMARIEALFAAKAGTPEGDELDLLVTLVELYEDKAFPIGLPDPIAAIQFRMEQEGLKAKDLVPFIGSASKVSEVLSGKRTLSLTMIRNLVEGLCIPAEVLLKEPGGKLPPDTARKLARQFPLAEMVKRRWFSNFQGTVSEAQTQIEDLMNNFVGIFGSKALMPALNRQHVRDGSEQDEHALTAWRIRVANLALRESITSYKQGTVTADFLRELARLSYLDSGPLLAKEFLNKNGIHVVCERHLPKTHLDGAALKLPDGSPVVALTLRHDRLDNFWFTLFHELGHVMLHLEQDGVETFFDDLTKSSKDKWEKEADKQAADSLIPEREWKSARITKVSPAEEVLAFAKKFRISPAIVAGRVRYESNDYTVFKQFIGSGKLRAMFGLEPS